MPRKYRITVPNRPHHVVQRGNRRQQVFFLPQDKTTYLEILHEQTVKHHVKILSYCLMNNHVHLILIPKSQGALAKAVAETHRRFTCIINRRYQWRGYLWQGRFFSSVMDDIYLVRALHYVLNNPVRAKLVQNAWEYPWSSARAHVMQEENMFLSKPLTDLPITDWKNFLTQSVDENILNDIRKRNQAGLPLAEKHFIEDLANELNIPFAALNPRNRGRPKKT